MRELSQDYDGDEAPVIRVSALKALEGDAEGWQDQGARDAVERLHPTPERDMDKPSSCPSRTSSRHRRTVVTGRGRGKPPDPEVEISVSARPRRPRSPVSRCSTSR